MMKGFWFKMLFITFLQTLMGCSSVTFKTVPRVDLPRFMGTWYVAAGRFTMFEKDVYNAVEKYTYDEKNKTIDIDFTYHQGAADGPVKKIPQTGWVVEGYENAKWKVSPLWPFKFDYLIVALDPEYSWVAIGVPDQKYLWIMFRKKNPSKDEIGTVLNELDKIHYDTSQIVYVPQT